MATTGLPCNVLLERTSETEENYILFVNICLYLVKLLPFKRCPCFATSREHNNGQTLITFSSHDLFSSVACQSFQLFLTFLAVYYNPCECFNFRQNYILYLFIWH